MVLFCSDIFSFDYCFYLYLGGLVAVYLLQVGLFSSLYKQVLDRLVSYHIIMIVFVG